uniref:O-fucosyltransferase family protein n=1 Tax=Oryza brachyantha TaxID=4533 RepID=J3MH07_ORYBR
MCTRTKYSLPLKEESHQPSVCWAQGGCHPSRSFELAHCSRCRIDWLQRDGILLLEVDRVLRPGGYFVYSSPEAYAMDPINRNIWRKMSDLARRMCWQIASKEDQTVIWVKPLTNECYMKREQGTLPPMCDRDDDPDAAWNVPMKACVTPYSERVHMVKGSNLLPWPQRLTTPPPRLEELGISSNNFSEDNEIWHSRVIQYWKLMKSEIQKDSFRNVMDMSANLGGFAASLRKKDVWVMNVVPSAESGKLKIIYDRGLVGTIHNWCESFSTYPRTYDLLHAWLLLSEIEKQGCSVEDLLIEMDRIMRPHGYAIIRDKVAVISYIKKLLPALRWDDWSSEVKPKNGRGRRCRPAPRGGAGAPRPPPCNCMVLVRAAAAVGRRTMAAAGPPKEGAPRSSSSPLLHHHHQRHRLPSPVRSLLALEDPRSPSASASYRILVAVVACLLVAALVSALVSAPSVWSRLNSPYLCRKDGIRLHCPGVNERGSLWENPHAAAASWKPCAERRSDEISDLVPENETSGYIFIHAEGGLNQQRIAICNAVAIAKIMNATLILPVLKQDQIWKDQTKFEDIFDVDYFINYLKDDVRIVREIPEWFTEKDELFTSIKRTVKNIPKYASAQFYIDNVLPRIKEKKIMSIKPFVDRLGYDNVPMEINRLRCRVNYHALKFLPEIEEMADKLATRMRNRTGSVNPYMALHLRFEKGMVGLSFCDFAGTRDEKAMMAEYRQKQWPRRYKNGSHLWPLALEKRKEGRCPLEPGEIGIILRAMGYTKETQIYVASGQVYGGGNRMAPLRNMFPNLVTKEDLASKEEIEHFKKHVTSLAALDFLVCLKSDVFVMTHGGNFAKLIIGFRRYMGRHRLKSIKPDKGLMSKFFGDPYMPWATFVEDVMITHQTRTGLPESTFPHYDLWENPLTPCMCRA